MTVWTHSTSVHAVWVQKAWLEARGRVWEELEFFLVKTVPVLVNSWSAVLRGTIDVLSSRLNRVKLETLNVSREVPNSSHKQHALIIWWSSDIGYTVHRYATVIGQTIRMRCIRTNNHAHNVHTRSCNTLQSYWRSEIAWNFTCTAIAYSRLTSYLCFIVLLRPMVRSWRFKLERSANDGI